MAYEIEHWDMYGLGRQAREAGFATCHCNLNHPVKRAWWLAGWHDLDMEKGVTRYFSDYKVAA